MDPHVKAAHSHPRHLLRPAGVVMKLARMGSAHPCRLSFMRSLLRLLRREKWQVRRSEWQIDAQGIGHAVYQAIGPVNTYSLVAFAHDLPDELRSDRVIAEAWDATFTLFDGVPDAADIQRLRQNVPLQEAGRISRREISLSRANRSVRLFDYLINVLATGQQPERERLESVGYLMRTTAVYGAGKFGAADRDLIWQREELSAPFRAEMLSVWLTRAFTIDLAEHLARCKGGDRATTLDPDLRRTLGVGNSTGLGMAPFLVNHPSLINNWILAREFALASVRHLDKATTSEVTAFKRLVHRARLNAEQWQSAHPIQANKITQLRCDLKKLQHYLEGFNYHQQHPWNTLYRWAELQLSLEGQEQTAMLLLEPYPDLVDELCHAMTADETRLPLIDGHQRVAAMREMIRRSYDWALSVDYSAKANRQRFWYVSEEKLEPRLGERFDEPGGELEQPLCIGWLVFQFYHVLANSPAQRHLADFLLDHPEYRYIARRIQQCEQFPYMEIQDNLIAADMLPIDMLRLKLSFFGATRFDPRSDRWVRINMFQYAPYPDELHHLPEDDWAYPPLPA